MTRDIFILTEYQDASEPGNDFVLDIRGGRNLSPIQIDSCQGYDASNSTTCIKKGNDMATLFSLK